MSDNDNKQPSSTDHADNGRSGTDPAGAAPTERAFTLRALGLGALFMLVYSYAVAVALNRQTMYIPSTQISSLSFFFALVLVLGINPLMKLVRLRPFNRGEAFLVFIMAAVPAGLPLFGYLGQTVPLIGGLNHPGWNTPQSQWSKYVNKNVDPNLFVHDKEAIERYVYGYRALDKEAFPVFVKKPDESFGAFFDRVGRWFGNDYEPGQRPPFLGQVPWSEWIVPLLYWLSLGIVLIVFFYALNELIFRQWYRHEKLVFPLAEMAETMLDIGDGGKSDSIVPRLYRNPLFWGGFVVAFGVIFYNGMVEAHWFEGLQEIPLHRDRFAMETMLEGTPIEGLNPAFRFHIFFVIIGLAFLLPTKISFSVWFFHLILQAQQLIAVWMGYGINGRSFPSNWISNSSFKSAQGGGAMMVFALVYLFKVRYQMIAFILRAAGRRKAGPLTEEDIRYYSGPSLLFFLTSAVILLFLWRGNVSLGMSLVVYLFVLIVTVAVVRIVCECGIISIKMNFGALHFMKVFGLLSYPLLFAQKGLATVTMFLGTMFFDMKAFIAPTMMNARFLAAEGRIGRRRFAGAILFAVAICLVVAAGTMVILAYDNGVGSMDPWFFGGYTKSTFRGITSMYKNIDTYKQFDTADAGWFGLGAVVCSALIYLRQFAFWLPHPIGLVLYVNPQMHAYWFSFLLAWICKKAAVRYLDTEGYRRVRELFIGLVLGEVSAVAMSLILALNGFQNMGITLNR